MGYFNPLLSLLHVTTAGCRCLFWLPGPVSLYRSLVPALRRQSLNQTSRQPVIQNKGSFQFRRNQLLKELVVRKDSTLPPSHTTPPFQLLLLVLGPRLRSSFRGVRGDNKFIRWELTHEEAACSMEWSLKLETKWHPR